MTIEYHESSYKALINMAQAIISSLDSDQIMDRIINEVISVLPYADTGLLYWYHEEKKILRMESIVGFPQEYRNMALFKPGECMSGRVFLNGEPEIINGQENCRQIILSMSKERLNNYLKYSNSFPHSIMSVPLKIDGRAIGVLTVDNYNYPGKEFSQKDLELLQAAANHVSVVITKSQLIQKLEGANVELKRGFSVLEQTLKIHEKLTAIALKGKGFQEIVDSLSDMIGYSVKVYDLYLKPLIFSHGGRTEKIMPDLIKSPEMKKLIRTKQWQEIKLEDTQEKLYLFPIAGSHKLLGFLAFCTPDIVLRELDFMAVNYGSTVLALEWLKQEEIFETSQKLNGEFLRDVLFSDWNNQFMIRANQLGFDYQGFYTIVLIKWVINDESSSGDGPPGDGTIRTDSFEKSIINLLETKHLKGIVLKERNYYCILLSSYGKKKEVFHLQIKEFAGDILSMHKNFQIGIGSVYSPLVKTKISYEEAKQCLNLLNDYSFKTQVLEFGELGVLRLILKNSKEDVFAYIKEILEPILEYDREKKSNLLLTLKLYVRYNRALNLIARNMNVHTNTVYYRIKKVEELLDIDLNEPNEWFDIQVVCKIMATISLDSLIIKD